jgi:hypothetical protein
MMKRSVMFTRPRSARLRSLHSGSLHITSLFFSVYQADDDAPLPLTGSLQSLLFRPAPHTMLRIVFVTVDRAHV